MKVVYTLLGLIVITVVGHEVYVQHLKNECAHLSFIAQFRMSMLTASDYGTKYEEETISEAKKAIEACNKSGGIY